MAALIAFSGLPASGKSTIARALALEIGGLWLRIDSIEQAIREAGVARSLDDAGYRAGYAVARDNLRLGHDVIADCVNPWMLTRDAWRSVAEAAAARVLEVEVVCSDQAEHHRRVASRTSDIAGLVLPSWSAVVERDYRPWERDRVVADMAGKDVAACVSLIRAALGGRQ